MRLGLYSRADVILAADNSYGVVVLLHLNAYLQQLVGDRLKMLGDNVSYQYIAAGCRGSRHKRARLDLVGYNAVCRAVKLAHSAYFYNVRTCADNIRAHGVQAVRQIDNVRLLCGILDNGKTFGFYGSHNAVYSRSDGVLVKEYLISHKLIRTEVYHTAVYLALSTQRRKAFEMLIYRTVAEIAASRHGNVRRVKSSKQCAEEIGRCPHKLCLLIRDRHIHQRTGIDLHRRLIQHTYFRAHFLHYL